MTAQAPGHRHHKPLGWLVPWISVLIEAAPVAAESAATTSSSTPCYRLSRSGQIILGLMLTLLAVVLYGQTLTANQQLGKRYAFCQQSPVAEWSGNESSRQSLSLISNLTSATPAQKLRLRQQLDRLVVESDRLCGLAALNHSQEAALMTVATAALCLFSLTVALGLVHGLANSTNRTLRAVQVTAVFLLVVPMVFLQLGEQVRNSTFYLRLYLAHRNLHQQLLSALANQDLPALNPNPTRVNQRPARTFPALGSSARVAELIRAMDLQVQVLPPIPLDLNDSTVNQVYHMLTKGWQESLSH